MKTRDQDYAEKSYNAVSKRINDPKKGEYKSFAKRFPTLIHTCGLMQAIAFAQGKGGTPLLVLEDFVAVIPASQTNIEDFVKECREMEVSKYMHTSCNAMLAAGWIKRQADALIEGED